MECSFHSQSSRTVSFPVWLAALSITSHEDVAGPQESRCHRILDLYGEELGIDGRLRDSISHGRLLIAIIACCDSKLLFHPILPTTAIISPPFVHGYTIPASKGEPLVIVPIALHGDTDSLDGAINAPGVDMGEV